MTLSDSWVKSRTIQILGVILGRLDKVAAVTHSEGSAKVIGDLTVEWSEYRGGYLPHLVSREGHQTNTNRGRQTTLQGRRHVNRHRCMSKVA